MYCVLLLILLHCCKLKAQAHVFTINKVVLRADPSERIPSGMLLTLHCSVDISKNEHFLLKYNFLFSKNNELLHTTASDQERVQYNISKARFHDSGRYECTVNVEGKTRYSNKLTVNVNGIMKPILAVQKTEVKEGEKVRLHCAVPEEKPPFVVTFYKTQQSPNPSPEEWTVNVHEKNFADIEFPADVGDTVLYFSCTARFTSLVISDTQISAHSEKVLVTVAEPFSLPTITIHPQQNITEGDNIIIECTTILGHQSQADIILQKDKKILNSAKDKESVKYFAVATAEDNGNYTCKVELGSAFKISTMNVVVKELFSKPVLRYGNKTDIDENSQLQIECEVTDPLPLNVSLMKDDDILVNSTVYATTAGLRDSGIYVCKAEAKGVVKKSDPVSLQVHGPVSTPIIAVAKQSSEVVVLGKTLVLRCYSKFGTHPIKYTLYRGDTIVDFAEVKTNESSEFNIATDMKSQGEYSCKAQNGHSFQRKSRRLNITVIAPVRDITMVRVPQEDIEDGQQIVFFCYVGSGSLPIEFKIFKEDNKKPEYWDTRRNHTIHWLKEGLTNQDAGKYYCRADNQAKLPAESNTVTINVILASWKKGLIVAFILMILLGIAISAVWWCFCKKPKGQGNSVELASSPPANNSLGEKLTSGQNKEGDFYYGSDYNEDGENHIKSKEENRGLDHENPEVEYTEVEVSVPDPYRAPVMKKAETVYTEIRKANNDAGENRNSRIESSPDGT